MILPEETIDILKDLGWICIPPEPLKQQVVTLDDLEIQTINEAIIRWGHAGATVVCKKLGISFEAFYRRLQRHPEKIEKIQFDKLLSRKTGKSNIPNLIYNQVDCLLSDIK